MFDPLLPPEVALTLESSPVALRAARTHGKETTRHPAYPDRPGPERAHLREAARKARKGGGVDPFTVFATIAFLLIVAGLTNMSGLLMAAVAVGVVAAVRQGVLDGANRGARRRLRIAMEYGDRYVLPEDLDRNCRELLRRAQDATDSVLASQINREGLIDTIDNRVTLPEETWRIAQQLARLSAMTAEHQRIVPRDLPTEAESAFAPYTAALDAAFESLSSRVQALEEYAWQVHRADQIYRAFQQLEVLKKRTPEYERLLADILRDEPFTDQVEQMSDRAEQVRELFQRSIDRARQAGAHLLDTRPADPSVPPPDTGNDGTGPASSPPA
ncbi:hypothetical protein [Thermostaphylospora chromogena]|uniref:Uncharacterized protein n=1 Tax=Thermostaphylospora chromogena TaxID=35622 RepID=A0A1H1HZT7_9ACTN|nr:hypothetical protein [Thermostaphylospora chromogena]SDR30991.1 hypothetical protein SAMN04489764_5016 [Thermostaphylospora chromogena]